MLRRTLGICLACWLLIPPTAVMAGPHDFGLGMILGEPSGISGKLWLSRTTAFDGAVAWSAAGDDELHLQGDFVWHDFGLIGVDRGALPVYYGVGGRLRLDEGRDRIGVRVPVGLAYIFEDGRFDLFMEVAPILDLAPRTDVEAAAGFGVRFFFP